MSLCYHNHCRAIACELDDLVGAYVVVCVGCGMMRQASPNFIGLWHDWRGLRARCAYPAGARFTVLCAPTSERDAIAAGDAAIAAHLRAA